MYTFDRYLSPKIAAFCLAVALCCGCAAERRNPVGDGYVIVPVDEDNSEDVRWAEYLSGQIVRRSVKTDTSASHRRGVEVRVHVDASLSHDFVVERKGEILHLSARDADKMLWLVYQFLSSRAGLGLDVADLPPAFVSMEGDCGDFAFEYRGIYTPSNSDPELMPVMASHNVDYDWALWGHNLRRVFDGGRIPDEARALVDGERAGSQFCFSSDVLFNAVSRFVKAHRSGDETSRFVIMPDDNGLVCQCPACVEAGNTPGSATPAVSALLRRLAGRYPDDLFFTSSYMTTVEPPSAPLPSNVGVLVSAISVPMREKFKSRPATKKFAELVNRWRQVAGRVYVWDYIRNFDDYLTPYPCLRLLRQRLEFYQSIGVCGVFLNGSSPFYAPFDDVQTAAAAAMLVRPGLPLSEYVDSCFARYYPATAGILSSAYGAWEDGVACSRELLPFYGGIGDAVKAWLVPGEYVAFCDSLDRRAKSAGETERARLNRMLTASWFTRLELLRRPGGGYTEQEARRCLEGLRGYTAFADMAAYREAEGVLERYIKDWDVLMAGNRVAARNRLRGVPIESVSRPDGAYADLSPLTDGECALPTDYHTGWVIASPEEVLWRLPAGQVRSGDVLSLSFLNVPRWRIHLPRKVEAWQGDRCVGAVDVPAEEQVFVRCEVACKLGRVDPSQPLELHLAQREEEKRPTLACDEVAVYGKK